MIGTTNIEIDEIGKNLIKNYRGTFMRNELTKMQPWESETTIVNLETSKDMGSHWLLIWKDGNNKIAYSSFGDTMPNEVKDYLGKNIYTSNIQIQDFNEDTCGMYCVLIAYLLQEGNTFEDIILELSAPS